MKHINARGGKILPLIGRTTTTIADLYYEACKAAAAEGRATAQSRKFRADAMLRKFSWEEAK